MGALPFLDHNPHQRYFTAKGKFSGISTKSRVFFGTPLFGELTDDERLALVAHEFVHIRERDTRFKFRYQFLPFCFFLTCFFVVPYFLGSAFTLLRAVALLASPLWGYLFWVGSIVLVSGRYRRMELRCDEVAVSFVSGAALITALEKADKMFGPEEKRRLWYRIQARTYPKPEERYRAIRLATGLEGN